MKPIPAPPPIPYERRTEMYVNASSENADLQLLTVVRADVDRRWQEAFAKDTKEGRK